MKNKLEEDFKNNIISYGIQKINIYEKNLENIKYE